MGGKKDGYAIVARPASQMQQDSAVGRPGQS